MKTRTPIIFAACVCSLFLTVSSGFAQGSLTPPGAPTPTMKTLAQIEPRTPISSAPFTISQPGSYYLTTNIVGVSGSNGISISANNVTLDLNGFALQGVSGSEVGIDIPLAQTNITVRNGSLSGWDPGVESSAASSANMVFERLNVSASATSFGFDITGNCVVRDCNCQDNGSGIYCQGAAVISGCTADNNGDNGILCTGSAIISGCAADNNGDNGIEVYFGAVSGCNVQNNGEDGIFIESGTVSGCNVQDNTESGIEVFLYAVVSGCDVSDNTGSGISLVSFGTGVSVVVGNNCNGNNSSGSTSGGGIYISGSDNRVEGNHVTASGNAGIAVASGYIDNIITKNSVIGNGASNYSVPAGNDLGPVGTAATATSPWANISH
jgi:parallel beta-helix repeat protein